MKWNDQGWGHRKGQVGLFTAFADGAAVYTSPVAPHAGLTAFSDTIQLPVGMENLEFKYKVGGGGGHTITIKDFAWSVTPLGSVSGQCVLDHATNCVCSSNFGAAGACAATSSVDGEYENNESCEVSFTQRVLLQVHLFDTESGYDKLTVDPGTSGTVYSGTNGPNGVEASALSWRSDHSIVQNGFKVCFAIPPPRPPPPPLRPPPPCDCDYHAGGCSISQPAPSGQACKCNYLGAFTCGGENTPCSNPASPFCQNPDTSVSSCVQGDGDCGGYSGASDCDCDYSSGGCKISQVAPAGTACHCDYMGAFTCDGEVVRCRNEADPLCANPDGSKASCQLGGGDCGGYPSPSPPPSPPSCDCDYHAGGCSISQPAPSGQACKCNYLGAFTCGGEITSCSNPASPFCQNPDTSVSSCVQGDGDCGGYSGANDCDCDYSGGGGFFGSGGGCLISQVAPAGTACHCDYMGAFTCDGEVVRCRDETNSLCANPDASRQSCLLGGGDCDGYD